MFRSKVVDSITHEPYRITVSGTEMEVPRPCMRQVILAEKYLSALSDTPEDASFMDKLRHLAECGKLARVVSIFLTGKDDKSVAERVEETWTVTDAVLFVSEVLMHDGEVEGFFVFTASLKKRNLLMTEADEEARGR